MRAMARIDAPYYVIVPAIASQILLAIPCGRLPEASERLGSFADVFLVPPSYSVDRDARVCRHCKRQRKPGCAVMCRRTLRLVHCMARGWSSHSFLLPCARAHRDAVFLTRRNLSPESCLHLCPGLLRSHATARTV